MPALVKRTLVFTLLLALVAIALGSSRSTQPLKSPYVSALNSYTVGTAVEGSIAVAAASTRARIACWSTGSAK